jgi:glycosyltransferase involved in cell wall biosynthesis
VRILILHSRYRSGPASGENRVVDDEARLLSEAGHRVQMFDPGVGNPSGLELLRTGARLVWSSRAAAEIRHRMRHFRPSVVHCHNLFPALSPAVLRQIQAPTCLVMTLHNYRLLCLPGVLFRDGATCEDCLGRTPWPGMVHACYQGSRAASLALGTALTLHRKLGTFGRVDRYLAISRFVRQKHVEAGMPPERIIVKPHFAWPSEVREGPGEYFLYLGRLSREKGVQTLFEAWRGIDARLRIVGDGPDALALRASAPRNVEFVGTLAPDRAQEMIRSARAVLVPSLSYEGAGRVVLEAYAAGVPAVANHIGGLPEVIDDDKTGLLVHRGDPHSWRRAISGLLDDAVSERLGRGGYALWNDRFRPEHGLADLEHAYRGAARL